MKQDEQNGSNHDWGNDDWGNNEQWGNEDDAGKSDVTSSVDEDRLIETPDGDIIDPETGEVLHVYDSSVIYEYPPGSDCDEEFIYSDESENSHSIMCFSDSCCSDEDTKFSFQLSLCESLSHQHRSNEKQKLSFKSIMQITGSPNRK